MTTEPAEKRKMTEVWIRIDPTITVLELAEGARSIDCVLMADCQGLRLERRAPEPRKEQKLKPGELAECWP